VVIKERKMKKIYCKDCLNFCGSEPWENPDPHIYCGAKENYEHVDAPFYSPEPVKTFTSLKEPKEINANNDCPWFKAEKQTKKKK